MATDDISGSQNAAPKPTTQPLPLRPASTFDIVQTYNTLLTSDPEISMPVAAIEALIALLGATPATTAMETVSVIKTHASLLLSAVPNPIPLKAGTDLFQQYLLRSLKGQTSRGAAPALGFDETREHLLANSRLFADRAKAAREQIAQRGAKYVRDGSVVLAAGGSRTVKTLLLRAADAHAARWGCARFKVVYVMDGSRDCVPAVAALREKGVAVAEIAEAAMAYSLAAARVDMAFVGTEVVVQNGGLLSRMGTFQLATLCKGLGVPFYVAAETHKIVRVFPLSQADLPRCGVKQEVLDFKTGEDVEEQRPEKNPLSVAGEVVKDPLSLEGEKGRGAAAPVDYTPPELVSSIITEQGVKMPAAVYDLLLDIYT
ncbi:nagb/rpia/CoA transferase-like protein [Coniochaeta ligniaria NRRL 30616]|uniref:Translation initiation factor eIF2B subunit alpha n=1 Tax=Coniochaeta ligniaria NRRL 30616 TaxID=1408157 RepID=A0A1J7JFM2_9PEZI|nr:nagb/rpia/CoA transferase-like protein [Coniochaeta ligniaria NRRL 30616]